MHEQLRQDANAAILFDPDLSPQVTANWFEPAYWRERDALLMQSGGRGSVAMISTPAGEAVLRHYRRGGAVAKIMGDRYLWSGAEHTRAFREFRLLQTLAAQGLPVPPVLGARYRRSGLYYRADLITLRLLDTQTLAQVLAAGRLDANLAREIGAMIARFHRAGVWHADLNAHNIMIAPQALYLIDFDRGELREPATSWRVGNLERLRRSLYKLGAASAGGEAFDKAIWKPLLDSYERAFNV